MFQTDDLNEFNLEHVATTHLAIHRDRSLGGTCFQIWRPDSEAMETDGVRDVADCIGRQLENASMRPLTLRLSTGNRWGHPTSLISDNITRNSLMSTI